MLRPRASSSSAPSISARRWRRWLVRWTTTSRWSIRVPPLPARNAFPDVPLIAEWPDVALPPLDVDHYTAFVAVTHDPKIDDPALLHALRPRLLLHRRARLAEDPCQARRAAQGPGRERRRHRPYSCADRPEHRGGLAGRDRGCDHGRDHRPIAPAQRATRHEIRSRQPGEFDRWRHRSHPASGSAGAEEGYHHRRRRGRSA